MENKALPNSYSSQWFEFFHASILAARTDQESAFIKQVCPLPSYSRLLDVCCGMGRHSRALAAQGYTVTGVERDAQAITAAREHGGGPTYVEADVCDYLPVPGTFDAVVNISEVSFHRWKRPFGQIELSEARRLKELERENGELKKMLAGALLKHRVLEAVAEKMVSKGAPSSSRPRRGQAWIVLRADGLPPVHRHRWSPPHQAAVSALGIGAASMVSAEMGH